MKKSRYTVLGVRLLAATGADVHAQNADTVKEWIAFIKEGGFMPDIRPEVIQDMLESARPGRAFSEAFDPIRAQTAVFFDKVIPQQDCFFDTLPNGELPQEECSSTKGSPLGPDAASRCVI